MTSAACAFAGKREAAWGHSLVLTFYLLRLRVRREEAAGPEGIGLAAFHPGLQEDFNRLLSDCRKGKINKVLEDMDNAESNAQLKALAEEKQGILRPDDPDFEQKQRRLETSNALYRSSHVSWWQEELPSQEEYQAARANLEKQ